VQPGIRELHAELTAAGIPVGLVTNSFRRLITIVLASTGLEFDVTIAGDELPENKPHPLPYIRACEQLEVDPHHVAVLEDSSTGIASARSAGCYVIAIPHLAVIAEADRQLVIPSASEISLARLNQLVGDAA
jgi:HAD superfamily hydrolase (TIGR01509 family)